MTERAGRMNPALETERMTLRPMTMGDVDPEATRYCPAIKTRAEAADWVRWNLRSYLFLRRLWGRGLATEAAVACRSRVISLIDPRNAPSHRVAEKVGLRPGAAAP